MSQGTGPNQVSTLVVDESFANGDDRFVDLVRLVAEPKYLAALTDRWKRDPRPWAREQTIKYLALPLDRPGHNPVVKRLFKHAEANKDDELMSHFLVAFDRLVRRVRRVRHRYDYQLRQTWQEEVLYSPPNQVFPWMASGAPSREGVNPFTGEKVTFHAPQTRIPKNGRLFSYATREYLRRRTWRYFRRMGFQRPADYPAAIAAAMACYRDDDFVTGENILDSWSLMNAAFYHSQALKLSSDRARLAEGKSLAELDAAPRFEDLWKNPPSATVLVNLLLQANSRLIRVWSMQLLRRHHAQGMQSISADQLLSLLDHDDEEVQQFGASLLSSMGAIDSWTIDVWLRLLKTRSVDALVTICDVMSQRVNPQRLSLSQCVEMACARATPVARLGLSWLKSRPIASESDRAALARLSEAKCDAVGAEATAFALSILGNGSQYETNNVVQFFDSLNAEVRRGAWDWLTAGRGTGGGGQVTDGAGVPSTGYNDAALWSRLVETPYDDVRLRLVDELNRRTIVGLSLRSTMLTAGRERDRLAERDDHQGPQLSDDSLVPIWTTVLLNVHRGGRAKLKALRQISAAMAERPELAERLIPVLAVAIRSVRPPEVRAGLSSILSAVAARPELESTLAKHIPELRLTPMGAAV